jgi:hypothetical protein
MPLKLSQMAAHTQIKLEDMTPILEDIAASAMTAAILVRRDVDFQEIPPVLTHISTALAAVQSALSVMMLVALSEGVDPTAQDTWEVPNISDRTSGEDPVYGGRGPDLLP